MLGNIAKAVRDFLWDDAWHEAEVLDYFWQKVLYAIFRIGLVSILWAVWLLLLIRNSIKEAFRPS